jgi:hypothetical protein
MPASARIGQSRVHQFRHRGTEASGA